MIAKIWKVLRKMSMKEFILVMLQACKSTKNRLHHRFSLEYVHQTN